VAAGPSPARLTSHFNLDVRSGRVFNAFGQVVCLPATAEPAAKLILELDLKLQRIMAWSEEMVLKLASDEVQEIQTALSVSYRQVLGELSRVDSYIDRNAGLELCRRKWRLEALIGQLERFDAPTPVLELVPAGRREEPQTEAA
jgi:hypothetical protein